MYSKEQLYVLSNCKRQNCDKCDMFKHCTKVAGLGVQVELAEQCLTEMEAREAAERKIRVLEYAIESVLSMDNQINSPILDDFKSYWMDCAKKYWLSFSEQALKEVQE